MPSGIYKREGIDYSNEYTRGVYNQKQIVYEDTLWMDNAECRDLDPGLFFPGQGAKHSDIAQAKAICEVCTVKQECLDFALLYNEKFGIWGGKSEKERRGLRKIRWQDRRKKNA